MWGAEALKRDFDVSIATTRQIDLSVIELNFTARRCGPGEVTFRRLSVPIPRAEFPARQPCEAPCSSARCVRWPVDSRC